MLKKSASVVASDDCGNHISCCAGALIVSGCLLKLFWLITNVLFGIFAGVINSYYICSYEKDRKAKKWKYPAVAEVLAVAAGCFCAN